VPATTLAPGGLALANAAEISCLRLEAASGDPEYLYVAYSAAGEETREGTAGDYLLEGTTASPPPAAVRFPGGQDGTRSATGRGFHDHLRAVGRDMARHRGRGPADRVRTAGALSRPPALGEERTFNMLRSADVPATHPGDFVQVEGTARYIGARVAIFLDNAAPAEGGYTLADLEAIGSLFDDHLHAIGTAAFGEETDVNGDGVILVLLSNRVNRLGGCGGAQLVVGYFFAVDLLPEMIGSNNAEIFYGLAPEPACGVTRENAVLRLPGVFIHEFQHMINYGQRVIERDGDAEDTWLDEGLSGYAEELGGRLVPSERCVNQDCFTQFQFDNLANAYHYLFAPGEAYLIGPRQPPLPVTQYGADWLFVRWLVDHFAEEQPDGADLTQALVQTTRTGAANVANAVGVPFDQLVGEWQLANYLDDHPDFLAVSQGSRFEYPSWNLRETFASFHDQKPETYPRAFPLEPERFEASGHSSSGSLRAGSGPHLLVAPGAGSVADLLLTSEGGSALHPDLVPRTAVLRLR
jgi:hypothetical protein